MNINGDDARLVQSQYRWICWNFAGKLLWLEQPLERGLHSAKYFQIPSIAFKILSNAFECFQMPPNAFKCACKCAFRILPMNSFYWKNFLMERIPF